jgi:uncharacterized repeat protein (TIGR01451 family)
LDLSVDDASPDPGQNLTFTVSVSLSGGTAEDLVVTVLLPEGLSFTGFASGPVGAVSGSEVRWAFPTASSGTTSLVFEAVVEEGAAAGVPLVVRGIADYRSAPAPLEDELTLEVPAGSGIVSTPVVYPNPAGTGTVMVAVPLGVDAEDVVIEVYTTAYRKVVSRGFGRTGAGLRRFPLVLRDDRGKALSNGLYHVRVVVAGKSALGKLLILR